MTVLNGNTIDARVPLTGESIASAAASCHYLYVASAGAFTTYDLKTLAPVATVDWYGGGRSSPAIGPGGYVYTVVSHALFVFPPAWRSGSYGAETACDQPVSTLGF